MIKISTLLTCLLFIFSSLNAQQASPNFIFGDALPDAPELATRGNLKVGVRTIEFINKDQIDILNAVDGVAPNYDRDLKVEIWYPAALKQNEAELVMYDQVMGSLNDKDRPIVPFTFAGRAARDATPSTGKFPLIVVSHGYLGSRVLMTYLTENLASKGYIVAAIGHKESTFEDANGFQSTLLNRPKDILFVMNEILEGDHFLSNNVQDDNVGIIGYSMGGYGVLNVGGAGYSEGLAKFFSGMTGGNKSIESLTINNPDHSAMFDDRIKCIVAFAPWGMERGIWNAEGLKGLKLPTFFVAGSEDDISGYEKGIKAIYEGASNTDRYLLTYTNARHNVAPNPPAEITMQPGLHFDEYYRYAEPSWDERRINNINQHFVTAFLGTYLKAEDHSDYLKMKVDSNEETWKGFKPRSSTGMKLEYLEKAK
ncbi:alpha/beta hydrolase family protein [Portibacter lacus]|uniref:Dienelactone hydrolase n=1 Tax=Portibacter lacus TaxID=1099794 RepID=A0AA37STX8_9BACT|nr:dienelactone hydrolase family protein [Portibacter lacus]GLR20117.1 hypothetical protein GCM10007940_47330 [Portibacter lacus]